MWHIPTYDDSIAIEYTVKTEPVTDSPFVRVTDSPSARITDSSSATITASPSATITDSPSATITDSPFSRITYSPSARITDSPSARITDSPSARITDSPSARITDSPSARITDSPSARITYSPSARNTDSPFSRITYSPSARNTDSPFSRITDSPFSRITDSPSANLSWDSIQSPPITSTPFIRRPARLTPYSRRNQNEEIRQKQEIQLKEEIQSLNDLLLSYKKSVQYLKLENSHLKQEIQTSQETITREISKFSIMFDFSLNKQKFDQMNTKCKNLDIENKCLRDANKDLKNELEKKDKDLEIADERIDRLIALLDNPKYVEMDTLRQQEIRNIKNKIKGRTTQVMSSEGTVEELTL